MAETENAPSELSKSGVLGRVLDRKYRITNLIGEGGMGAVYEARHILLDRRVAVKVMHPEYVSKPESVERFFREAKAASAIGHPNIVEIHDVGREDDDTVFIVMERLNGRCLDELIDETGPVASGHAVTIALQILSALGAAHAKGIIHRDLKAENIFLSVNSRGQEEVKLLDFGIAKIEKGNTANLGLTKEGNVVGTPYYLSPEQARGGREVDHRIDLWGVGVLLYEMLGGVLPFTGENYNEILGKILLEEPEPLAELAPGAPADLVAIVERAMSKERDDRFATAQDMIEVLYPLRRISSDNMSTVVIQTLKGNYDLNSDPPGAPFHSSSASPPTPQPGMVKSLRDSDPNARTSDIDTSDMQFVDSSVEISTRRYIPLVAISVVVALGIMATLGYVFLFGGIDPAEAPEETVETMALPVAAAPVREEEAEPELIQVTLRGAPIGSVVTLDGEPVALPIRREKGTDGAHMVVKAPGYVSFEKDLTFDENAVIDVEMALEEKPVAETVEKPETDPKPKAPSSKKKKRKGARKKPGKKRGAWESNPFG